MKILSTNLAPTQRPALAQKTKAESSQAQPLETFEQSSSGVSGADDTWKSALGQVAKSAGFGALDGAASAGMRALAFAIGGPVVGQVATVALIGAGATLAVMQDGERMGERVGEKTLGKFVAGVMGAGRTALTIGALSGGTDLSQSLIGGAAIGGTFGLLDSL